MDDQRPASEGVEPYKDSVLHARVWMGFGLPAWARLVRLGLGELALDRWLVHFLYAGFCPINSALGLLDDLLGPRDPGPPADGPLFVIGHWRTGTTLLHEILAADPAAVAPTTYQCFAPLHFRLTQRLIPRLMPFIMPRRRPTDSMPAGWLRPQEDEFALAAMGVPSPYLSIAYGRPVDMDYLDFRGLPQAAVRAWGDALVRFVGRVGAGAPGRRVVLKSPTHTARVGRILEAFPQARFLHLVRDPTRIFPSTVHLWRGLEKVHRLGADGWPGLEEQVLETLPRMYAAFARDQPAIPPGRHHLLRYEDLVADPVGRIREAYARLDLGDSGPVEGALRERMGELKAHRKNVFARDPARDARVMERWAAYAATYGYAAEA